ncbi:hypothetical protein HanXRQr2_Chr09g0374111 [Helianthus annuus]|uniref:Uncharacterized protein n=1 Tax=Helianthus annuus TaxID=4232 RepID=A0A9K3I3A9_HELAN|nr:hypothetical protein HanXRQr2_Chr09g0374111 [Helianthus annuus]
MSAPALAPPAPNAGGSLWRLIRRRCIQARQAKQTSSSHRYPSRRHLGLRCLHHRRLVRDVINEKSGDGRSIRMIQHTTRRIVLKRLCLFYFSDYVAFIIFTKLELVIVCFFYVWQTLWNLLFA